MKNTHYAQLEVERSASSDQIKSAYRKLARKFHPDVSKEADAAERIKSINEAYSVLGDPDRKRAYDAQLEGRQQHSGFSQDVFSGDLHDLFEHLFSRRPGRKSSYLSLTLEQAFQGGRMHMQVDGKQQEIDIPPGVLEGDLLRDAAGREFEIRYAPHARFQWQDGHIIGPLILDPWVVAMGGKVKVDTLGGEVEATLPAGLQEGQRIRLAGRGMPGHPSHTAGDHWGIIRWRIPQATTEAQRKAYKSLAKSFQVKSKP